MENNVLIIASCRNSIHVNLMFVGRNSNNRYRSTYIYGKFILIQNIS